MHGQGMLGSQASDDDGADEVGQCTAGSTLLWSASLPAASARAACCCWSHTFLRCLVMRVLRGEGKSSNALLVPTCHSPVAQMWGCGLILDRCACWDSLVKLEGHT